MQQGGVDRGFFRRGKRTVGDENVDLLLDLTDFVLKFSDADG